MNEDDPRSRKEDYGYVRIDRGNYGLMNGPTWRRDPPITLKDIFPKITEKPVLKLWVIKSLQYEVNGNVIPTILISAYDENHVRELAMNRDPYNADIWKEKEKSVVSTVPTHAPGVLRFF